MTPGNRIDLSVVIVTHNTRKSAAVAVRSVFDSRDALVKEVVVVDNGSADDTPEVLPREFPAVRFIRSDVNLGFARAANLGARQAGGEFLLLLNSDARLEPDTLAQAVGWVREHPQCGVAGAQLLDPDGSRQNSIANFPSLATELLNKSLLRRLFPGHFPGKERPATEPLEVESVIGAFLLIRRDVWQAVGGLDERYFFFLEETDFCLQVRRRGWKVFHLPQARVWHEQGASARSTGAAARVEYWRSRYAYFEKNGTRLTCALLRGGLRVRLLADWFASTLLRFLTFGRSPRWRSRHEVNSTLRRWHARGRPSQMGLPR